MTYERIRYTEDETAVRAEFRNVRQALRDAEMYQDPRAGGSHFATIEPVDATTWTIRCGSNHPTYFPTWEQIENTVTDIVRSYSTSLKAEKVAELEILVSLDG